MTRIVSVASAFPRPWSSVGNRVVKIKRESYFRHAWTFLKKESKNGGTLAYRQLAVVAPRVGQNSCKSSGQGIFGQRLNIGLCMYFEYFTDYIW